MELDLVAKRDILTTWSGMLLQDDIVHPHRKANARIFSTSTHKSKMGGGFPDTEGIHILIKKLLHKKHEKHPGNNLERRET